MKSQVVGLVQGQPHHSEENQKKQGSSGCKGVGGLDLRKHSACQVEGSKRNEKSKS